MSQEPIFDGLHEDLFDTFAQAATVVRGAYAPEAIEVVVDGGVAQYDDLGRVARLVTMVSFRTAQWQPLAGDEVTTAEWTKTVDTIEQDDGFVCKAVMYG